MVKAWGSDTCYSVIRRVSKPRSQNPNVIVTLGLEDWPELDMRLVLALPVDMDISLSHL